MHRVHVVIGGRVQGVGFRWFVATRARALGLHGWVRNRVDGAVEVEAEGERKALERLLAALRQGPSAARVADVQESWREGEALYHDFEVERDG